MWLPAHRSKLVLTLQGHLPGKTKGRAWSPALTSMLRSRYLSTWGLRSGVLLGVEWLHKRRHKSAGSCREPALSNIRITGMWPVSTPGATFTGITACYDVPFPFSKFLVHGEPSWNSGLGEETPQATGRVPAGKPIHPSEDALPMCGQNSSPGVPQYVPNKPRYWDDGEVGNKVRHGKTDQK